MYGYEIVSELYGEGKQYRDCVCMAMVTIRLCLYGHGTNFISVSFKLMSEL